jgi:nicotinate-nucleotide adenylyltransferase
MKVALFGGSFNPPHVAHQLVALYVLETQAVDELWFVPAFQHPFDKPLAPFSDRRQMCELATAPLAPRARVCDIEARLGGASRTLRTVKALQQAHPDITFSLVVGADLVGEIPSWHGAEELTRIVTFIVVGRTGAARTAVAGQTHEGVHGPFPTALPVAMPEVSSTAVRAALGRGDSVDGLVPRAVLDFIRSRGLYGRRQPP